MASRDGRGREGTSILEKRRHERETHQATTVKVRKRLGA